MNVYDFAIQVEQRGRAFYRVLAEKAATPGVARIFTMMAKDEQALMTRFRAMKAKSRASLQDSSALERLGKAFVDLFDESTQPLPFGIVPNLNHRNELCYGLAVARDRDRLAGLDLVQQLGELGFRFKRTHSAHGAFQLVNQLDHSTADLPQRINLISRRYFWTPG